MSTVKKIKCVKRIKVIYSLKHAARVWYTRNNETLRKVNFVKITTGLFTCGAGEGYLYTVVYVDDILSSGKDTLIKEITQNFRTQFEINSDNLVQVTCVTT